MRTRIRKGITLAAVTALLCGLLPGQGVQAAPGAGTADGGQRWQTIRIRTTEDFCEFARQCYLDAWSAQKWVELEADIDLADSDFQMIPVFAGTFDGGGHTISGFHDVGDGYVGGLFRYIEQSGVVKNLNLKGSVEGTEEKECIGSICGVNYGTIQNCSFEGTIRGRDTVGGIAGINEFSGLITDCSIRGHVAGYYTTGGIVGLNHGSMTQCRSHAGVNDDTQWVEQDDEMGGGLLLGISGDTDVELFSGVDTGGIAGYSDGTISRCTNYGRVGYEHTGYNIGGIAGRQAGALSFSVNEGQVYGRKDVGGIVGQMEPNIEVDEAASLRNAVNKLHDLIEKTLNDMQAGKNVLKADVDSLTAYGDAALDSGLSLADRVSQFTDANMGQAEALVTRMEYVTDQLPGVTGEIQAAQNAYTLFDSCMNQLWKDWDAEVQAGRETGILAEREPLASSVLSLQQETAGLFGTGASIGEALYAADGSPLEWRGMSQPQQQSLTMQLASLPKETRSGADDVEELLNELRRLSNAAQSEIVRQDLEAATDALEKMSASLQNAAVGARNIAAYVNGQPDVHFSSLGEGAREDRLALTGQLQGVMDSLKRLSQSTSDYSDLVNEDLKAVNDQLNVVFNLLADHLSGSETLSVEELYEEVSDEEIDSVTSGRADACTNKGIVKGDINIGGIAGSMAIDEEDPEDNAAGSIDYEIGQHFVLQCILADCVNEGYITAKKDGAGGIVGYMAHGAVVGSEGYGSVESTEGGYVGGICGQSLTVIRSCYALCDVSGGRNVGGIAGYADTLKDCRAIVNVEASDGRKGAIAGQIAGQQGEAGGGAEANVSGNFYVDDTLYGIDNISYVGVAEPIGYQELLETEGLPAAFRHLKVIYRVEDEYLGSEEVAFGAALTGLHYPEFPEKEGCYGVWPDYSGKVMTGNLVVRGEYHDNVPVVESGGDGQEKPYGLAEQIFTEDTVLTVTPGSQTPPPEAEGKAYVVYDVSLENSGLSSDDTFALRLLNPYEDAQVFRLSEGVWVPLESKARGTYLQVEMTGEQASFCIVETGTDWAPIAAAAGAAAAAVLLVAAAGRWRKKKSAAKRPKEGE